MNKFGKKSTFFFFLSAPLLAALRLVSDREFPQNWNNLVPQIMNFMKGGKQSEMFGALCCFQFVLRKYQNFGRHPKDKLRWPIHKVAEILFPPLLGLFQNLVSSLSKNLNQKSIVSMVVVILKIFWICCTNEIPPLFYKNPPLVEDWIKSLIVLSLIPIPENLQPNDLRDRPEFALWYMKRRAAKILCRMGMRWGDPSSIKVPVMEDRHDPYYSQDPCTAEEWNNYINRMKQKLAFAHYYKQKMVIPTFECFLNQLSAYQKGVYICPKVAAKLLRFVSQVGVQNADTWNVLVPHLQGFLTQCVFRAIHFTPVEVILFQEDPADFVRQSENYEVMVYNPRLAGLNVLMDVLSQRAPKWTNMFVNFLSSRITAYNNLPSSQKNPLEKEAVMACIGALNEVFMERNDLVGKLESIFFNVVYPEMNSNNGILQWRALWVLGRIYNLPWSNSQNFQGAVLALLKGLNSKYLPCRVQAGEVIGRIVRVPAAAAVIGNYLGQVIKAYVEICSEVDSDDLLNALHKIVEFFPDKIAPFAMELCHNMIRVFKRLSSEKMEDDPEAPFIALNSVELLVSIVDLVSENEANVGLWNKLVKSLTPFMFHLISGEGEYSDCLDHGISLCSAMTFDPPHGKIEDELWAVLPALYKMWTSWAYEYLEEMVALWDNFLYHDPQKFLSNRDLVKATVHMSHKTLTNKSSAYENISHGLYMIEAMLANCKGKIKPLLNGYLDLVTNRLQQCKNDEAHLSMALLTTLMLFVWHDPQITLNYFEGKNATAQILNGVFKYVSLMHTEKDKKFAVLGLSTLLYIPVNKMPSSIQANLAQAVKHSMGLMMELWQESDERAALQQSEDPGAAVEILGLNDKHVPDDQDVVSLQSRTLEMIESYNPEVDDADDFDWRDPDEENLVRRLSELDEVLYWYEGVMKFVSTKEGKDVFVQIMASLTAKDRKWYEKLTRKALEKKNKQKRKNEDGDNNNNNN